MIQPGFMVLQGNRLESLRAVCVEWLQRYPLTPLENEVILVQSNGIAQWLKLALAEDVEQGGCGIAAAMDVCLPARYLWRAYRAVLGDLPNTSPYDKDLLTWRLLRLLPSLVTLPEFERLRRFLQQDPGQRKTYQLAQRLADLLDQYQIYRADWLNAWAQGRDEFTLDQAWQPLPANQRWQAELWRRLLEDLHPEQRETSRAHIHQRFLHACTQLTPETRPAQLPRRVIVFGLSSLPQQMLEVLSAVSSVSQVLLCVHNPSPYYWGDLVDPHAARFLFKQAYQRHAPKPGLPPLHAESDDQTLEHLFLQANPLLAAWGKQGRDYMRLLDEHDQTQQYRALFQQNKLDIDLFEAPTSASLLHQIQADIYHLRSLDEARLAAQALTAEALATERGVDKDLSLSFHRAHSSQREVEILQDYLLALFAREPDLKPRDVLVMVPDINTFAPYIRAVFGRIQRQDPRYLPFTLSDQGQRQQHPLFVALTWLLALPESRFSVSELLDFLDVKAVQARFGLEASDKPLLQRWIEGAGIRWGLDAEQRQALGLPPGLQQNTWEFGLQRMLLGYALGPGEAWQGIHPYAEVAGLSAELLGKLMQLLNRLEWHWQGLQTPQTPDEWSHRLHALVQDLFLCEEERDQQLIRRIEERLQDWLEACQAAEFAEPISLDVMRDFLLQSLDQPHLTQRFLAGAINFATLMPMRAIPFRHICLLGMNDGDYPRQVNPIDFDLMRLNYRAGDRSRREDDRYLFLEALLSAREGLYISWTGYSIRDNSERAPSVLVGQLRDYLLSTQGPECLAALTQDYPLQAFSHQYFRQSSGQRTFAHEWAGIYHPGSITTQRSDALTPVQDARELSLTHLSQLLRNPAASFFQERLGISFYDEILPELDDEPFDLQGLALWKQQHTLIEACLEAWSLRPDQPAAALLHEKIDEQLGCGNLPLGPFAQSYQESLHARLLPALSLYQQLLLTWQALPSETLTLQLDTLALTLQDELDHLYQTAQGQRVRCLLLASQIWSGRKQMKWHHLARQWPQHLAAQLQGPTDTWILGPDTQLLWPSLPADQAQVHLCSLMQLWHSNLNVPLQAACQTSCAFLLADPEKKDPLWVAEEIYMGGFQRQGEVQQSGALARLWPNFQALQGEQGFERDSQALYGALLQHPPHKPDQILRDLGALEVKA
ncbi:exodeoxyribonuclease V subunit gamma [Nitrincola tapanii]|uniref:RecBCD enzyme subunit RecC n=1 Tax=Nitrincola tapanii TaxID=1708751 RepID=A0A5A9W486_9GAMM|nr:exodeoxyribonuclease V subunit gamma [Nitrincola tapanii]KAA0875294.1 exodeoxyribonuclease V subunit gamma [Nitrincola tapanii]